MNGSLSPLGAASDLVAIIKTWGPEAIMNRCQLVNLSHLTAFQFYRFKLYLDKTAGRGGLF